MNEWLAILQSKFLSGLLFYLLILFSGVFPFFLFLFLSGIVSNIANKNLIKLGGYKVIYITGWIGVPIHELSHLIAAIVSGHKIKKFAPFAPNPITGQLGVVETSYNQSNWYQNYVGRMLISVAPLIGGTIIIYFIIKYLIPTFTLYTTTIFANPSHHQWINLSVWLEYGFNVLRGFTHIISQFWQPNLLKSWKTWLAIYFIVSIAFHLLPSDQDWQNFLKPFILFLIVLFLLCQIFSLFSFLPFAVTIWSAVLNYLLPIWLFTFLMTLIVNSGIILFTHILLVLTNRK